MSGHTVTYRWIDPPWLSLKPTVQGLVQRHRPVGAAASTRQAFCHAIRACNSPRCPRISPLQASPGIGSHLPEDELGASNASIVTLGELPVAVVKSNGSLIVSHHGDGDDGGSGNGNGGSGDDRGDKGSEGADDGPDNLTKALLLLLTVVVGTASLYGIYHLASALQKLITRRQATQAITSSHQRCIAVIHKLTKRHLQITILPLCSRSHDDTAALKRLLRELFTNQIQTERRVSALEPQEDAVVSFDPLERSRQGWGSLSGTGKAKVELSGNLVMGSALLYSKARH